jgi:hypothetical protein
MRRLRSEAAVAGVGDAGKRQRGAESKHEDENLAPHRRLASYEMDASEFDCVGRRFQTEARAEPVPPGGGTASGALGRVEGQSRVHLPPGVGESYEVYVNGIPQEPGRDFDRIGDELVFRRALAQEGRLGPIRWLSMLLGVAGTYRKHETVDVIYETDGRRTVATLSPNTHRT